MESRWDCNTDNVSEESQLDLISVPQSCLLFDSGVTKLILISILIFCNQVERIYKIKHEMKKVNGLQSTVYGISKVLTGYYIYCQ